MGAAVRLTPEEKKARERLRLVTPQNAGKVLRHCRYWSRQFVELLMARCDDLGRSRPDEAALIAEHLPALVSRVRLDDSPESYPHKTAKRSALAMAHVLRDHYSQKIGHRDFVEEDEEALGRLLQLGLEGYVLAERLKRQAIPVFLSGDPSRALRMLSEAIELATPNHPRILHEALSLRGMLRQQALNESALEDFSAALLLVETGGTRGSALFLEAALTMDYDLVRFDADSSTLQSVGGMLKSLRKRWAPRTRCRAKAWLFWLSGTVFARLAIDRYAHRLLTRALDWMSDVGRPFECSMLRLDLALVASSLDDLEGMKRHALAASCGVKSLELSPDLAARLEPLLRRPDSFEDLRSIRQICWPEFAEVVRE
ncbi:MAG: hypothetical protein AAGC60_23555 [Acidobacteriota bacterium]